MLRFPPRKGRRQGQPLPSFFSNLPAVSRRLAVASLLDPLNLHTSLGLRRLRGAGLLKALEAVDHRGLWEQTLLPVGRAVLQTQPARITSPPPAPQHAAVQELTLERGL